MVGVKDGAALERGRQDGVYCILIARKCSLLHCCVLLSQEEAQAGSLLYITTL